MTELEPAPLPSPDAAAQPRAEVSVESATADAPLTADGRERPRFLTAFPADPELQRLVRAFEAGNYEAVREGASKLAEATPDPIVREAARELRRRIDPDPLMKYLLAVSLLLFVFVVWYTYQGQSH
jgi:hypothetical protein